MFKGSAVWVRAVSADDNTHFLGQGGTAAGKKCVIYKQTPNPQWYWVQPDLVLPREEGESSSRRSRRFRDPEQVAAEDEAELKRPRHADNGKLYGIVAAGDDRRAFVRGSDKKDKCKKCDKSLASDFDPNTGEAVDGVSPAVLGFIEATKEKTVRKRYGGEEQRKWQGTFSHTERDFYHLSCWEVPKTAQRSLRGLIDIMGFDEVVTDKDLRKHIISTKLADVRGAQAASED